MTVLYIIIGCLLSYIIYFKYLAPFANHSNKPYSWHSSRLTTLPNFEHKMRYIYHLNDLALSLDDKSQKENLLLICTDIATDLKFSCNEKHKNSARKVLEDMLKIYHREK